MQKLDENSFCPNLSTLGGNLKRREIWGSLEVHVVYALVYIMCTNKKGLLLLKTYLTGKNHQVFDPFFIAQYLLAPVNTIDTKTLLPWMLREYQGYKGNKMNGWKIKAPVYLRYALLSELLTLVHKHGNNLDYNFDRDVKLSKILEGKHGLQGARNDQKHITCAIDSFMKIWLLTLPEKFHEWYDNHKPGSDHSGHLHTYAHMDLFVKPTFPVFDKKVDSTTLYPNPNSKDYRFLPYT